MMSMELDLDDDMAMDIYWQPTQIPCAGLDNIKRRAAEETTRLPLPPPAPSSGSGSSSSSSSAFGSQSSQSSEFQSQSQSQQRRPRGRPPRKSAVPRTEAQIVMKQKMERLVVATVSGFLGSPPKLTKRQPTRTDPMDLDSVSTAVGVAPQRHALPERAPRSAKPDATAGEHGGLLGMHPRRASLHLHPSSSSSSASSGPPSFRPPVFRSSASAAPPTASSVPTAVAPARAPTVEKPPPPKFVPTASQSLTAAKALGMRRQPAVSASAKAGSVSVSSSSSSNSGSSAGGSGYRPFKPPLAPVSPHIAAPVPAPALVPVKAAALAPASRAEPAKSAQHEEDDEADTSDTSFGSLGLDIDTIEAICSQYDRPVQRSV